MNSIGLENPGIAAFLEKELPALAALGPVVIANLSGSTIETYAEGARLLSGPAAEAVDMIELNISCPNVKAGGMAFGLCASDAASVVRAVRAACGKKPLLVKLSPNAGDLCGVARACEEEGADALSLVNTFKAIAIDVHRRRPVFDNVSAGLSGPAIKPIALRMVWEVCDAVNVPVIGMGGIATATDALEFLMAGASAVQVGAATFARSTAMTEIIDGIAAFLEAKGISKAADAIGAAKR
jgi:dihydroorotate dehydrogenase (NAD+) catalytic subunit